MSLTGRLAAICLIGMIIPPRISAHPLDALSAAEISATVEILRNNGSVEAGARFPTLTLQENDKASVRSWRTSDAYPRRAFVVVVQNDRVFEGIVDIGSRSVDSWVELDGVQPRVMLHETEINDVLWESADWRTAMARRGYDEGAAVFCAPLTLGVKISPPYRIRSAS